MTLQAILFDLDGTLADTMPMGIQAIQATIEHFSGRIPDQAELYALVGITEAGILERLLPGRLAETLPYYLDLYERLHLDCTQVFPGVENALSVVKARGIKTAIVTGKSAQTAATSVRLLGLDRWIDIVEPGFLDKPDKPRSIRLVLERWGMPPNQAAYVGDMPSDMKAADKAGLYAVGAAWAETSTLRADVPPETDQVFYDLDSFSRWIEHC
jgi:pyrophosphatase PpaX